MKKGEMPPLKNPLSDVGEQATDRSLTSLVFELYGPDVLDAYLTKQYLTDLEEPREGEEVVFLPPLELDFWKISKTIRDFTEKNHRKMAAFELAFYEKQSVSWLELFWSMVHRRAEAEFRQVGVRLGGPYEVLAVTWGPVQDPSSPTIIINSASWQR
jgi:hypothetical protein